MTTTPNPPASIESLRNDLALIDCDASHTTAKVQAAKRRVSAAITELEGLRGVWKAQEAMIQAALEPLGVQGPPWDNHAVEDAADLIAFLQSRVTAMASEIVAERSRADALGAKIGQAPEGSHPDEQEPRGATWHDERQNWQSEVARLTAEVQRVTRNWEATQERCEILADDAVAQQNRADALGARCEALEDAHRHIVGICGLCPDSRWAVAIANQSNLALSSTPTADLAAHDARVRREALEEAWERVREYTKDIPDGHLQWIKECLLLAPEPPAPSAGEEVQDV